jgi:hypothetical protein
MFFPLINQSKNSTKPSKLSLNNTDLLIELFKQPKNNWLIGWSVDWLIGQNHKPQTTNNP